MLRMRQGRTCAMRLKPGVTLAYRCCLGMARTLAITCTTTKQRRMTTPSRGRQIRAPSPFTGIIVIRTSALRR